MSDEQKNEPKYSNKDEVKKSRKNGLFSIIWKALNAYKLLIDSLKAKSKHVSCPHSNSCVHYILTVCKTSNSFYSYPSYFKFKNFAIIFLLKAFRIIGTYTL